MSQDAQGATKETKKVTTGSTVSWVYSILAGLSSIGLILQGTTAILGVVILLSALVAFPPLAAWVERRFKFVLSGTLKVIIVIVLLVIAGANAPSSPSITTVAAQGTSTATSTSSNTSASATPTQPAIHVSASTLANAFDQNQVAADAKYKNNLVDVTGIVARVGKDIMSNPFVELKSGEYSDFGVQCTFPQSGESVLASISSGQSITLEGTVTDYDGIDVLVSGCSIVK